MILFVAGPARSGTSALAQYLNQHPRVLESLFGKARTYDAPCERS